MSVPAHAAFVGNRDKDRGVGGRWGMRMAGGETRARRRLGKVVVSTWKGYFPSRASFLNRSKGSKGRERLLIAGNLLVRK